MLTIPWTTSTTTGESPTTCQISRLELARLRDVPGFLVAALKLRSTLLQTLGAVGLSLRAEPTHRTFWTLSAWTDADALRDFTRGDDHRNLMSKYRERMAGSHFHTWAEIGPNRGHPTWDGAMRRYDAATPHDPSSDQGDDRAHRRVLVDSHRLQRVSSGVGSDARPHNLP